MGRPCIGICRYEKATRWCLGCGMTKREKKAWKDELWRPAILAGLPARLEALAQAGYRTGRAAKKGQPTKKA